MTYNALNNTINFARPKKATMNEPIDSIFSTANGGYSAYIYKVSCGYKVDITRQDKTCVYYCKSESDCYNVITNATK